MSDLRQEQIDRLGSRIDYLDREPDKAIAEKKAQIDESLTRRPKSCSLDHGCPWVGDGECPQQDRCERNSVKVRLQQIKQALEKDPDRWIAIEKERFEKERAYIKAEQEHRQCQSKYKDEVESWLQSR